MVFDMPFEATPMDTSPESVEGLRGQLARREPLDIEAIEDRIGAHEFAQRCARELEEDDRLDRNELITTEVLEMVATIGAGALSTWHAGSFPIGGAINGVLGVAAKAGSLARPKNRALRVACRTGKVLLHSQVALVTRTTILGTP